MRKTFIIILMAVVAMVAPATVLAQTDSVVDVSEGGTDFVQETHQANPMTAAQQAATAYDNDNFQQAANIYTMIAQTEGTSAELFYNMGNTQYRLGNMGLAILYYEKSLALDPSFEDARTNLDFINERLNLSVDNGATYLSDTIRDTVKSVSSNTWAIIGITLFLLFVVALAVYIFGRGIALRKIGFFGGGVLLLLAIVANVCAFYTHSQAVNHDYAIITVPSVTLSTSPRLPKDKSEEAFMLREGMKIELLDSIIGPDVTWYDVRADQQHRAWVSSKSISKI